MKPPPKKDKIRDEIVSLQRKLVQLYIAQLKTGEDNKTTSLFLDIIKRQESFKKHMGRKTFNMLAVDRSNELLENFLTAFSASDADHPFVKNAAKLDKLRHVSSFRTSIALRSRRLMMNGIHSCPEWVISRKDATRRFSSAIKARIPKRYITRPGVYPDFIPNTVVKPKNASQSNGVYLVKDENNIFDVRAREQFSGPEELFKRLKQDLKEGRLASPAWIVEELITNSNNPGGGSFDWKCYTFYGKVMLTGVIQRRPEHREVWFDHSGSVIDRGFSRCDLFLNDISLDSRAVQLAEEISLKIPAPFVRIDFLDSPAGYVLGEITARPGTFHLFSKEMDRVLGDAFIDAEARLQDDLLQGKAFVEYKLFSEKEQERENARRKSSP